MSDAVVSVEEQVQDGVGSPPNPPPTYQLLNRVRWIGYVLLGLQGVGFLIWTAILYKHFSLTVDYEDYGQAWFLIAHGNLNPIATRHNNLFWNNDGELLIWVLAPLYWTLRSGVVLIWAQDLSLIGGEVVAFTWLCDLVRRHCAQRDAALLAGLGGMLFLVSPWLWWTSSWDVHMEPMVMFFAVYMAWDLSRGKRRAFVWAVPVLLGGAPDTTYVIGIALGGVLFRRTRRMGAALASLGIAYFLLLSLLHGNGAAAAQSQGALGTALHQPFRLVQELWDRRADILANLAPGGLLGVAAPMITPLALVAIVSDSLARNGSYPQPSFQNVTLYVFLPVGTVAVLAWLLRRHRRAAFVLAGVVAAQAIGWAAVWGPRTPGQWLRVSNAEAATLASVAASIPASAEVVASQGVIGRFSERTLAYPLTGRPSKQPVKAGTWFVITPTSGIETASPAASMALIGELAGPLHATLITHANGVWAFRLNPLPGTHSVTLPGGQSPLPAWAGEGAAGVPDLSGPVSGWHMTATGTKGYVADGIEWLEKPGDYRAEVTMSASAPVNVELWDNTTNTLLARRTIAPTNGIEQIELPVAAPDAPNATSFDGWGPFHADFILPPKGQRLEIRVWSPGGVAVNVYNADLTAYRA